jgi:hypothetical protein
LNGMELVNDRRLTLGSIVAPTPLSLVGSPLTVQLRGGPARTKGKGLSAQWSQDWSSAPVRTQGDEQIYRFEFSTEDSDRLRTARDRIHRTLRCSGPPDQAMARRKSGMREPAAKDPLPNGRASDNRPFRVNAARTAIVQPLGPDLAVESPLKGKSYALYSGGAEFCPVVQRHLNGRISGVTDDTRSAAGCRA